MIYNDYAKSVNIAHDWIHWPCVRVSSAEVPSSFGKWTETWVFSDCPKIMTTQVFRKTRKAQIKAHGHIVNNLRDILKERGK